MADSLRSAKLGNHLTESVYFDVCFESLREFWQRGKDRRECYCVDQSLLDDLTESLKGLVSNYLSMKKL